MKKVVALLLAFALLLSLAGCGASPAPASSGEKALSQASGEAAGPKESSKEAEASPAPEEPGSPQEPEPPEEPQAPPEPLPESGPLLDGKPWMYSCLQENVLAVQRPLSPRNDFYLYVNYDWLSSASIPEGGNQANSIQECSTRVTDEFLNVMETGTIEDEGGRLARTFYRAHMDWDARNAAGVEPLRELTDRIRSVSDTGELTDLLCGCDPMISRPFSVTVDRGLSISDTYMVWVMPPSLMLEDSAEYGEGASYGPAWREAYRETALKALPRLGFTAEEAGEIVDRTFALEEEIAGVMLTSADKYSTEYYHMIDNVMSRGEVRTLCGPFPLIRILDAAGFTGVDRYVVQEPALIEKLAEVYTDDRLEDLKSWTILHTVLRSLKYLDRESVETDNELYNAKYGSEGASSDRSMAAQAVRYLLPEACARAFFERHDPSKMKEDVTRICEGVVDYYRGILAETDWLSPETREKAVEKLDALNIRAVCPDTWRDYGDLSLEGLGLFECVRAALRSDEAYMASIAETPADPDSWWAGLPKFRDVLQTNAYYDPSSNSIVILRGLLDDPIYREDMSYEELCGTIGMVAGHEISHAFDPQGSQFDARGALRDWWKPEDLAAFSQRADRVTAYYNAMTAFGGYRVSGANIRGEAIADMGAVKCMLGLLESREGSDLGAFFESYARLWQAIYTREMVVYQLLQDPHPTPYLRVNAVLPQFPQFLEYYGISEGDGMYLAPEDRVLIW